jgi:hypothetical protein
MLLHISVLIFVCYMKQNWFVLVKSGTPCTKKNCYKSQKYSSFYHLQFLFETYFDILKIQSTKTISDS